MPSLSLSRLGMADLSVSDWFHEWRCPRHGGSYMGPEKEWTPGCADTLLKDRLGIGWIIQAPTWGQGEGVWSMAWSVYSLSREMQATRNWGSWLH